MMKRVGIFLVLVLTLSTVLVACGGGTNKEQTGQTEGGKTAGKGEQITLKLAHSGSETHQYQIAAAKFKELLEEKSNGSMKVDIFNGAVLGNEGEVIEQILDGTIDMTTLAGDSSLANTVPEFNVFGIPFIFRDLKHVHNTLDGEVGKELLAKIDAKGMKGLGFWEVGFRHLTNDKKEIKSPSDMNGLKIRVQPAPVWEAHMKALGASPTPVPFNELYTALDQGVVNGQENPLATIHSMNFYEVQPYLTLTGHTYTPAVILISEKAWNSLSEEQQKWVEEATAEATAYQRDTLQAKEKEIIEFLENKGVTITTPDFEAFREATKNVKEVLSSQVPSELIEKIINVQ